MKTRYKKRYTSLKLILVLLLTIALALSIAFSKYTSQVSAADSAKVALMANDAETTVSANVHPGSIVKQQIIISNYAKSGTSTNICDVAEKFKLEISSTNNLPLTYKLYTDEACTNEITATDGAYESDSFAFTAGTKADITVYLRITWNETDNSYTYSDEIDNIKVKAIITQID